MDEVIREIRKIRDELAEQFHYDVRELGKYIQQCEAKSGRTYVHGKPKLIKREPAERETVPRDQPTASR